LSHLINNQLIWISNPKCASYSIETALRNSKLKLEIYDPNVMEAHYHVPLNACLEMWGKKETICITRDWLSRWLSALNYIWDTIENHSNHTPICKWEDIDNEFIYKTFDTDFLNHLHLQDHRGYGYKICFLKVVKEKDEPLALNSNGISTLISQRYIKSNTNCTYEFDIKEIDKFIDFIEEKFGERLVIETKNQSTKRANKIIINDELKQWVWDNFEKRFEKNNHLI
jgi:hypothetical protein